MIAVIDYGAGNIQSVVKALRFIGCDPVLTGDPEMLGRTDAAVLPGVGSFGDAMQQLHARGLVEPIRRFAASGKPFLGICLGLQLLFESSEESPGVDGLGILKGRTRAENPTYGLEFAEPARARRHFPFLFGFALCLFCSFLLFAGAG